MSRLFVPKNSIVSIEQMDEAFELEDQYGKYKGLPSDYVCTREEDKGKFILAEAHINENYVEVKKVEQPKIDFTYEDMAKGYAEMSNLNQEEDWSYIKREKGSLESNKPF